MIESITISGTSSFGTVPEKMDGLSELNFLFGSNGTGKTTISRLIADESQFPTCAINWKGGTKLQALVYNRDFIERNFNSSSELKGVFTLGEKQDEALKKIATEKENLDAIIKKIETLAFALQGPDGSSGIKGQIAELEIDFRDKCWAQKQKHDAKLSGAFEGFRNSSEKFKIKALKELAENTADLLSLSELEKKAETLFGPTPVAVTAIQPIDATKILSHEGNSILKKRVIGKDDVDIAALIKKLGNSDWVREGRAFYNDAEGLCPFCQQKTPADLAKSLNEYFDEMFVTDSKAIEDLNTNYSTDTQRLQQQLAGIIASPSKFLDVEKLKLEKQILDSTITINTQRLAGKKKEASQVVELESLTNILAATREIIDAANVSIAEHNKMVTNLSTERNALTAQVWKFVLEELKTDFASYADKKANYEKAFANITAKLQAAQSEKREKEKEIRQLEKQTASVQPTVDAINALLLSFGFKSFSLATAAGGASYKLIRTDGSDAKATLSEGEKTFVTFLYFYHLLKGSNSEGGISTDRVVVFDDPVSSLDSDVLFIVGSLIKGLFEEVRNGIGYIKQVFVLTHNVYFHKEVAFNPNRRENAMKDETFWVVRKPDAISKVEKHSSNPIKTSYELLWSEVRRPDRSTLTIQNTLRRILENYFKILGGVNPDDICAQFEGKNRLICKSLFSWVNDGSHFAHDDIFISVDGTAVDTYLSVFRSIFEKSGHLSHYKMMMGEGLAGSSTVTASTGSTVPVAAAS